MANVTIEVDAKAIAELAADMEKAKRQIVGQLGEKGYQLLRDEVPVDTGNLKQGVASPDVDFENLTATLTVSARSGRTGSRQAVVVGADGKEKKKVTLRAQPSFNYAEAVAEGRPSISPKRGKALLIPVPTTPTKGGYLIAGGQIFVVRKSARAVKANPFHERAGKRLEESAASIAEKVLRKFV